MRAAPHSLRTRFYLFDHGMLRVGRVVESGGFIAREAVSMIRIIAALDGPFRSRIGDGPWQSVTSAIVAPNDRHALEGDAPVVMAILWPVRADQAGFPSAVRLSSRVNVKELEELRPSLRREFDDLDPDVAVQWGARLGGCCEEQAKLCRLDRRIAGAFGALVRDSKIRRDDMARTSGLSPSRFSHLFTQELGASYEHFTLISRVRNVAANLAESPSLTRAALMAGFSDLSHCTRTFRRTVGAPPSAYLGNSEIELCAK